MYNFYLSRFFTFHISHLTFYTLFFLYSKPIRHNFNFSSNFTVCAGLVEGIT